MVEATHGFRASGTAFRRKDRLFIRLSASARRTNGNRPLHTHPQRHFTVSDPWGFSSTALHCGHNHCHRTDRPLSNTPLPVILSRRLIEQSSAGAALRRRPIGEYVRFFPLLLIRHLVVVLRPGQVQGFLQLIPSEHSREFAQFQPPLRCYTARSTEFLILFRRELSGLRPPRPRYARHQPRRFHNPWYSQVCGREKMLERFRERGEQVARQGRKSGSAEVNNEIDICIWCRGGNRGRTRHSDAGGSFTRADHV